MPLLPEADARAAFDHILASLGIRRGAVVYLAVDMGKLPLPNWPAALIRDALAERSRRWCAFVLARLLDAVGDDGTVLVPAFSYSYTRGVAFDRQSTPSEVGPFTEFVRQHPQAIRSLHPLFSVAGVGAKAAVLLEGAGKSGFGPTSPFGRLAGHDAQFVFLGNAVHQSMTYLHHLEQMVGVNHRYNKAFTTPVSDGGIKIAGPWLANLRWRGLDCAPGIIRAERDMRLAGVLTEVEWQGCPNQAVDRADTDRVAYATLAAEPAAFAEYPVVVELDEDKVASAPARGDRVRFVLEHAS